MNNLAKQSGQKKLCHKCNKEVPLKNFYMNKENKNEMFRDCWCKDCFYNYVHDEDSLREYFFFNNRVFPEQRWTEIFQLTKKVIEQSNEYKDCRDIDKINKAIFQKVTKQVARYMSLSNWYQFVDNIGDNIQTQRSYNQNETDINNENEEKQHNAIWHGNYTKSELKYLEYYFNGLERDFKLSTSSYIDYARKVAKASLGMDKAFSDVLDGKAGSDKKYKDCKDIFDALSQSAKFSEKTRSENDSAGFGSLGEITKRLEIDGFLQKKITFEKDDVDSIIEDFRWILASIGVDTNGEQN